MNQQSVLNTFERGVRADITPDKQPAGFLREAQGLTLAWQPGGGGEAGQLTAAPGAEAVWTLPAGYREVGSGQVRLWDGRDYLLLVLVSGTATEIGLLWAPARLPGSAPSSAAPVTYKTLYNDTYDPHGARLGFTADNTLRVCVEPETERLIRVYLNDRQREPMAFSLADAFADADTLTPHAPGSYPRGWSAHAFALTPAVQPGVLKLQGRITGTLTQGMYRYAYRYVLTPAPDPENVVSAVQLDSPAIPLPGGQPDGFDHHRVAMGASGTPTPYGLEFRLEGVDTRWARLQLLASYSPDGQSWKPWLVADEVTNPAGPSVFLRHTRPQGLGRYLDAGETARQDTVIRRAADLYAFDSKLLAVGPELQRSGDLKTDAVSLSVSYRNMALDDKLAPRFENSADILQHVGLTSQPLELDFYRRADGTMAKITFPVTADYATYKGLTYAQRMAAYRHRESYPIGAVVVDDKGMDGPVVPLGTFEVPAQADGADFVGNSPHLLTGFDALSARYHLRLAGLRINGLVIPRSTVFDAAGRRRASAIKIVRGPAAGRILHQGILTNCCVQGTAGREDILFPLPTFSNFFEDGYTGGYHRNVDGAGVVFAYKGGEPNAQNAGLCLLREGYFTYLSGDALMEGFSFQKDTDTVEVVGAAHPVYKAGTTSIAAGAIHLAGDNMHVYSKNYQMLARLARPSAQGRAAVGARGTVRMAAAVGEWNRTIEKFDPERTALKFESQTHGTPQHPDNASVAYYKDGLVHPGTVLMSVPELLAVDAGRTRTDAGGLAIVDYCRQVEPASPETVDYTTTGYILPLTDAVLAELPLTPEGDYILGELEVYGGDTYPTPVDLLRLYPFYSNNCDTRAPRAGSGSAQHPDLAVGHIVPLECRRNLWLRGGRHLASHASQPQALGCGYTGLGHFAGGINVFQGEFWSISAAARAGSEGARPLRILPPGTRLEARFPYSWVWSELKTSGEALDRYRRLPALNIGDADGSHGPIVALAEEFQYLYAIQHSGVGRLRIAERSIVLDQKGEEVVLGTGRDVGGIDYVRRGIGAQRWEAVFAVPGAIYWVDQQQGKFYRFTQAGVDPISDRDGQHDRFSLSLPPTTEMESRHLCGVVDLDSRRVLVTLAGPGGWTVCYHENLNAFEAQPLERPDRYHYYRGAVWSSGFGKFWRHRTGPPGTHYGLPEILSMTMIAVPPIDNRRRQQALFHYLSLDCSAEAASRLMALRAEAYDDQGYGPATTILANDSRLVYRQGRLFVPLRAVSGPRLYGTHLRVTLEFATPDPQKLLSVFSAETFFQLSPIR